ncbi:MAG: JAB domain-containing protein [Sphingobium sp.]
MYGKSVAASCDRSIRCNYPMVTRMSAIGHRPFGMALNARLIGMLSGAEREHFWCFFVGADDTITDGFRAVGDRISVKFEARKIIRHAMDASAGGVLLVHNHPSGDSTPSAEDIRVTRAWHSTCGLIDIKFWDHIIVGGEDCFSFRDAGLM